MFHCALLGQAISGKSNSIKIEVKNPEASKKTLKPTIKWVYPDEKIEVINEEFTNLKLGINSESPLVKVTLILNDEVVSSYDSFNDAQSKSGYLFDAWIEQSIILARGVNEIMLVVQNDLGALQHKRKIEVKIESAQRQDYALIVGIDEYNSWNDLEGPIRDAEKLARELELNGFQIDLIRDATTFDILDKLEQYARMDYGPHDQLLVYFAGNGYYDELSGAGYFVCKNSIKDEKVNVTYLSYQVIKSILNNIPVPHIFLLMDAVKGQGEALPLSGNHSITSYDTTSAGSTRIGLLSGMIDYKWNNSFSEGSPLSMAFISYLRKSVRHTFSWTELLAEFEKIHPRPIYVEFGDHKPGNGFTFQLRD